MKQFVGVVLCAMMVSSAWGSLRVYTDEAGFLAAIAGYTTISEGFESSDWDASRSPSSVSSVVSQGITWTASDAIATNDGWVRSGNYGIFDTYGNPDMLIASTNGMIAAGGWFASVSSNAQISLEINNMVAGTIYIGQPHRFFGVLDTDGFNSINFASNTHYGADDFTFAIVPEPATLSLLAFGVMLAGRKRRK